MSKLKAFVRFDGTGRIIPGSLILRAQAPKVGNWKETPAYECCTTGTTTTINPLCRLFSIESVGRKNWTGIDCNGQEYSTGVDSPSPWKYFQCAQTVEGVGITPVDNGLCTGCYIFRVGGSLFPLTVTYDDCNGFTQELEINEVTDICAGRIYGNSTDVDYIGPCTP
jgi:hypothetical protein